MLEFIGSSWVTSRQLCEKEFGPEKKWPINARTIVTGAVAGLLRKIRFHRVKLKIEKRGGGRRGVEYRRVA